MEKIELLKNTVRPKYTSLDPSHDFAHIERVVQIAKKLAEIEKADVEIVMAAAYLHDIVNLPKDHPQRSRASELAAASAQRILVEIEFDPKKIENVCNAVLEHSFSRGFRPSSLESAIVQDADRLDALGAIGIMRTVTCGALMKASYYNVDDPMAKERSYDDKNFTLDHFYVKLYKLKDLMNTSAAKEEADHRISFMKSFVAQLMKEI
ncbi:HD domain-containing protein [Bacteriovorax sp. BSW11_IV]|uniref:HD domain-containing protein n=1 Tax=Bacteriovorax sp. BSW11_IV TaxID=1353529 RepID=UPI000697A954|nr:HD domain-containing protein [Bacteriovorax sp. BSW11_IV]